MHLYTFVILCSVKVYILWYVDDLWFVDSDWNKPPWPWEHGRRRNRPRNLLWDTSREVVNSWFQKGAVFFCGCCNRI